MKGGESRKYVEFFSTANNGYETFATLILLCELKNYCRLKNFFYEYENELNFQC